MWVLLKFAMNSFTMMNLICKKHLGGSKCHFTANIYSLNILTVALGCAKQNIVNCHLYSFQIHYPICVPFYLIMLINKISNDDYVENNDKINAELQCAHNPVLPCFSSATKKDISMK